MTLLPSITPRTWSREIHVFKLCLDSSSFCSAISCQEEINPRCFEDLGSLDKRLQRQSMDIPFPAVITLFMFPSDYAVSLNRSSTALLPFTISQVSSDGWEYPDHIVHPAMVHSGGSIGQCLVMSEWMPVSYQLFDTTSCIYFAFNANHTVMKK